MSAETLLQIGGYLVGLIILYFIIRAAVSGGTKALKQQLILQNSLKLKDLDQQGVPREDLEKIKKQAYDAEL